jgi:AraC-like DNA-binding protein
MAKSKIEIAVHVLFWLMILSAINIDWTSDWFDPGIRPDTPAPLSLIMLAIYFYVNAFVLIPRYFALETWKQYILSASILFILPELIRIAIYQFSIRDIGFERELFSRDSFLFGAPSPFFLALNFSFTYQLTKNWFLNKYRIKEIQESAGKNKNTVPYQDTVLLTDQEAKALEEDIMNQLGNEEIYLNPDLTLRDLAESVGSTEKKVSYLINQNLNTNFYELINKYRVEKFKVEVAKAENRSLSIVGLALNCGFPSKSSFYRAFKAQVALSPSEYIKKITDKQ